MAPLIHVFVFFVLFQFPVFFSRGFPFPLDRPMKCLTIPHTIDSPCIACTSSFRIIALGMQPRITSLLLEWPYVPVIVTPHTLCEQKNLVGVIR
jgi:hypothetical protein